MSRLESMGAKSGLTYAKSLGGVDSEKAYGDRRFPGNTTGAARTSRSWWDTVPPSVSRCMVWGLGAEALLFFLRDKKIPQGLTCGIEEKNLAATYFPLDEYHRR